MGTRGPFPLRSGSQKLTFVHCPRYVESGVQTAVHTLAPISHYIFLEPAVQEEATAPVQAHHRRVALHGKWHPVLRDCWEKCTWSRGAHGMGVRKCASIWGLIRAKIKQDKMPALLEPIRELTGIGSERKPTGIWEMLFQQLGTCFPKKEKSIARVVLWIQPLIHSGSTHPCNPGAHILLLFPSFTR